MFEKKYLHWTVRWNYKNIKWRCYKNSEGRCDLVASMCIALGSTFSIVIQNWAANWDNCGAFLMWILQLYIRNALYSYLSKQCDTLWSYSDCCEYCYSLYCTNVMHCYKNSNYKKWEEGKECIFYFPGTWNKSFVFLI